MRIPLLAIAAATAIAATPATAVNVDIAVQGPVVEITASETVLAEPDQATVSAGVTTRARTAVQAMRDNATKMDAVIARLKALGIKAEDIQTSGVNLNAAFDYRNNQTPVFQGYDLTNQVSVTLRDIPKIGPTLDSLVESGANNINGPYFSRKDDKPQRGQAREAAFKSAQAQAQAYARMAGYGGVRLLAVEETLAQGGPIPFDQARQSIVVTGTRIKNTPIEPGQVGTIVQLTAKYEMTR